MTYDNIKSLKKPGLYPLSRRHVFGKTTEGGGGVGQIDSPPVFEGLRALAEITKVTTNISLSVVSIYVDT